MVNVGERLGLLPDAEFLVEQGEGDNLKFTRTSVFTRKRNTMELPVKLEDFRRWRSGGGMIQDIFPQLNADQREFLMTGATPEEWVDTFGSSDDEEDPVD